MKYTEEMILHSDSGYCMPFEEPRGKDVELSLGYGEQVHPTTGEKFFHHGIDFKARYYILSAVASGIVSGVGNDPVHGICQTVRYGGYEVTYGLLSNVFAQFGQRVKAGQTVALSGERLHIEVKFKGEELNPIEFLTMLYGNIKALQETDGNGPAGFYDAETGVKNDYEKDQREIEELMLRLHLKWLFPVIQCHRHIQFIRKRQQSSNQPQLDRREAMVAIQNDHTAPN